MYKLWHPQLQHLKGEITVNSITDQNLPIGVTSNPKGRAIAASFKVISVFTERNKFNNLTIKYKPKLYIQ
jgi:hypothetical protein